MKYIFGNIPIDWGPKTTWNFKEVGKIPINISNIPLTDLLHWFAQYLIYYFVLYATENMIKPMQVFARMSKVILYSLWHIILISKRIVYLGKEKNNATSI